MGGAALEKFRGDHICVWRPRMGMVHTASVQLSGAVCAVRKRLCGGTREKVNLGTIPFAIGGVSSVVHWFLGGFVNV
jgi:hypothetical protein